MSNLLKINGLHADKFDTICLAYAYFVNGEYKILYEKYKKAKQIVQTLADMTGRDMYLYSLDTYGQIYYCRKIKCVQSKLSKNGKK